MENVSAMQDLCARGMLPPEFKLLVETIGLEGVSDRAIKILREVVGLTEGQAIINRLMGRMIDSVFLTVDQAATLEAEHEDEVNLNLDLDPPITEPVIPAPEAERDPGNQSDQDRALARGLVAQPPPVERTTPAEPPAAPIVDDIKGPDTIEVQVPDPLDHDGDGAKGGSLKGAASTASKGKANRKGKAKPKSRSRKAAAPSGS